MKVTPTDDQLRAALYNEYERLCIEDPEDDDIPLDEYREDLKKMTREELIEETSTCDEYYPLEEYMEFYGEKTDG